MNKGPAILAISVLAQACAWAVFVPCPQLLGVYAIGVVDLLCMLLPVGRRLKKRGLGNVSPSDMNAVFGIIGIEIVLEFAIVGWPTLLEVYCLLIPLGFLVGYVEEKFA